MTETMEHAERPIRLVPGTRDWLSTDCDRLDGLEALLLATFREAGYRRIRTPILEYNELHQRKSGAGIVSKLFEVDDAAPESTCLRPELTASIARAYIGASTCPPLPWRVCMSGPVFRRERAPGDYRLIWREFTQAGVELIGAGGPEADAEVIALADRSLVAAGLPGARIRIGHVGLIVEILGSTGLPSASASALVEMLSADAAEGARVVALESALERLDRWLRAGVSEVPAETTDDPGVGRLFRQMVPDVTGRRSGAEILHRIRRKWELGHSLGEILGRVRDQVHDLAVLRGPADDVLGRLGGALQSAAPRGIAELHALVDRLGRAGIDPRRVDLDLGFGRGIGFYSGMVFQLWVEADDGPVEVGGGGRYDGLVRVLGSDRDDRGAGFAFGLERLAEVVAAAPGRTSEPPRRPRP